MKTCQDCGSPVYNLGCTWCNELDYIEEQAGFDALEPEYEPPKAARRFEDIVPALPGRDTDRVGKA